MGTFDPTKVPNPPLDQPLLGEGDVASGMFLGAVSEGLYMTMFTNGSGFLQVDMWLTRGRGDFANQIAASTELASMVEGTGGSNDRGDVVVVARDANYNWSAFLLSADGSRIASRKVSLPALNNELSIGAAFMNMDGSEIVVSNYSIFTFNLTGTLLAETTPPFQDFPFEGTFVCFPRAGQGLWLNTTVPQWSRIRTDSDYATDPGTDRANDWRFSYELTEIITGTPPNESHAFQWLLSDVNQVWGGVQSDTSFPTLFLDIPDIANGWVMEGNFNNHYSTTFDVVDVIFNVHATWSLTKWTAQAGGYYSTTSPEYARNRLLMGPWATELYVNGDLITSSFEQNRGTPSAPFDNGASYYSYSWHTALPTPGVHAYDIRIISHWPTEDDYIANSTIYADSPPNYDYWVPSGAPAVNYDPTESDSNTHVYYGAMNYFVHTYLTIDVVVDSSRWAGPKLELRDLAAAWAHPDAAALSTLALSQDDVAATRQPFSPSSVAFMETTGHVVSYRVLDTEGNVLSFGLPRQFAVNWPGTDVQPWMLSGAWKGMLVVSPIARQQNQ